ncbi:MAG TPA: hypothetical protein VGW38_17230 [Chloroflexota bacterium]|nr:hypothetical protein [Chloroflexota bacterium]
MRFALALLPLFWLWPSLTGVDTGASSLHGTLIPAAPCEALDLLSPTIDFKVFQAAVARHPDENSTFPQPDPSPSGEQTTLARTRCLIAPAAVAPVPHHCERLPYQPTGPPFLR